MAVVAGCPWKGALEELAGHLRTSCDFAEVKCANNQCCKVLARGNRVAHEASCVYRLVTCEMCAEVLPFLCLQSHVKGLCPSAMVKCAACGEMMMRSLLGKKPYSSMSECHEAEEGKQKYTGHYRTCPKVRLECEYHNIGCSFLGPREAIKKHLLEGVEFHAHLVSKRFTLVLDEDEWEYGKMTWTVPKTKIKRHGSLLIKSQRLTVASQDIYLRLAIDGDSVKFGLCCDSTCWQGVHFSALRLTSTLEDDSGIYKTTVRFEHDEETRMTKLPGGSADWIYEVPLAYAEQKLTEYEDAEGDDENFYEPTGRTVELTRTDMRAQDSWEVDVIFKIKKIWQVKVGCESDSE